METQLHPSAQSAMDPRTEKLIKAGIYLSLMSIMALPLFGWRVPKLLPSMALLYSLQPE